MHKLSAELWPIYVSFVAWASSFLLPHWFKYLSLEKNRNIPTAFGAQTNYTHIY